jgi:hypothetical protein
LSSCPYRKSNDLAQPWVIRIGVWNAGEGFVTLATQGRTVVQFATSGRLGNSSPPGIEALAAQDAMGAGGGQMTADIEDTMGRRRGDGTIVAATLMMECPHASAER